MFVSVVSMPLTAWSTVFLNVAFLVVFSSLVQYLSVKNCTNLHDHHVRSKLYSSNALQNPPLLSGLQIFVL